MHCIHLRSCKKKRETSCNCESCSVFTSFVSEAMSDPWRSFVTLFPHAEKIKNSETVPSRRCAFWDSTASFTLPATSHRRPTIVRAISRKLIWSGSDSRLKYRKEWPSCGKRRKKRANGRRFPRLTLDCLIFSRVHLAKPRIMSKEKEVRA